MTLRLLWLCALGLTAACTKPEPSASTVPTIVSGILPLGELHNITLGQSLRQIRAHRPNTQPAPFVGLNEVLAGDTVFYSFEGRRPRGDYGVDSSPIYDDGAELRGVYSWKHFPSDPVADSVWNVTVSSLAALHGPGECGAITSPLTRTMTARWALPAGELAVLFTPAWTSPSITGDIGHRASVRILVAQDADAVMPELTRAVARRCP
jgi:hypothetical protein